MAKSDSFVEFVVEQLHRLPDVRAKRMFGGHGIYSRDFFFAVIGDGRLFFKTDADTVARYERAGMEAFEYAPGKKLKTYFQVPIDVIEDDDELVVWANEAVAVAKAAAKKKRRSSKRR